MPPRAETYNWQAEMARTPEGDSFAEALGLSFKSRDAIVYVPTSEEGRVEEVIEAICSSGVSREVFVWDHAEGFVGRDGDAARRANPAGALEDINKADKDKAAVFVLRDFHRYLDDVNVSRRMRNLARDLKGTMKSVVILAPSLRIPSDLQEDITILELALPSYIEIDAELERTLAKVEVNLLGGGREALIRACQGLTLNRVRSVLAKAVAEYQAVDERAIPLVLEEKKQAVRRTEVLEFSPVHETLDDVGGMDLLKKWLSQRAGALTKEARDYGLPNPKGVLFVGVSGTGKSLAAKATASQWQLPLLRLDIGRLMGGLVGESEARTREMIRIAEAMAPCVLFLDELDKGFAGLGGEFVGDSGTSARVFGTILTWMEEKKTPVFVAATANNVHSLPPEVLRKGRFDEIFFVDLPSERERQEIFQVHLGRVRGDLIRNFNLEVLAFQSVGFSGAEIEEAINDAMHVAFNERREFTTDDILNAMSTAVPLSRSQADRVTALQEWAASGHVRPASSDQAASGVYGQLFGDGVRG